MYRMEPKTKKWRKEELKSKNGYAPKYEGFRLAIKWSWFTFAVKAWLHNDSGQPYALMLTVALGNPVPQYPCFTVS